MSILPSNNLSEKIGIFVSARNLPKMDVTSNTDPFAVLYSKDPRMDPRDPRANQMFVQAMTNAIQDTQSPDWPTHFIIDYHFETVQDFMFRLYDQDGGKPLSDFASHDFIGEVKFNLSTLMCSVNQRLELKITGGTNTGTVIIKGEAIAHTADRFICNFSAASLCKMNGFFGKADPFVRMFRIYEDGQWGLVYQGEPVMSNLNPTFLKTNIPVVSLCNGDLNRPIKIELWDFENSGKHQFMGMIETNVNALLNSGRGGTFDLIEPLKRQKDKSYKNSGTVTCKSPLIELVPTLTDFIMGGMDISLTVGIDFTGSNGPVTIPNSLHYIDPQGRNMNQYQAAIASVGAVLQEYDSDRMYPVFGFGAKVRMPNGAFSVVQHCFPVYGGGVEVSGVEGIMQAYKDCVMNVALSGPTLFSPLIEQANALCVQQGCSQQQQKYSILLIITDGEINDMEQTIGSIVRASYNPMSIIIVGVGGADFTSMNRLDGDDGLLRSGSMTAMRDIVQFVPFRDFLQKGPAALAAEVLAEVPKQITGWMKAKGIVPNPPRQSTMSATTHGGGGGGGSK